MFRAALLVIKTRKQAKYPLEAGQINKCWYIYTVEYYTATKMNSLLLHATNVDKFHRHDFEQRTPDTTEYNV